MKQTIQSTSVGRWTSRAKKVGQVTNSDFYRLDFEHLRRDVGQDDELETITCLEGAECKLHALPELPYSYDALEPYIDADTLEIHHRRYHRKYIEQLNRSLTNYPSLQSKSLEELLRNLIDIPFEIRSEVRNFAGGHFNHSLLWQILTPHVGTKPSEGLMNALNQHFGTYHNFKKIFKMMAQTLFGSGYLWLIVTNSGDLILKKLPNQDCPLIKGLTPILLIDLWEHAYYSQHQNRREDYVEAFWNVINWNEVSLRWETIIEQQNRKESL
jgi:superoxide dismutase, Fe-Mn family